jgi:hypothetical protein
MGVETHNDSKGLMGGLQDVIFTSWVVEVIHLGSIYARMIWEQDYHKQLKLIRPFLLLNTNRPYHIFYESNVIEYMRPITFLAFHDLK